MKFKDIFLAPNLITLSRLIIVIVIFFQFTPNDFEVVTLIVFIAIVGLSDSLDGIVARRFNLVSKLGTILDPFTDRVVFILLLFWIKDYLSKSSNYHPKQSQHFQFLHLFYGLSPFDKDEEHTI